MNLKSQLYDKIQAEYQLGHSHYQAFANLSQQFDPESQIVDEESFNTWLQQFQNGQIGAPLKLNQFNDRQYFLFTEIVKNYWTFEKSIFMDFKQTLTTYKLLQTNARYAFRCQQIEPTRKLIGIEMLDLFHGEKRTFSLTNSDMIQGLYNIKFSIRPLDYNFLIAHESPIRFGSSSSTLYLLKLDYTNWACEIVDQLELDTSFKSIVFDKENDEKKFVLIHGNGTNDDDILVVRTGSIQNQHFVINQKQHIIRVEDSFCLCYAKNKLSGLQMIYGENAYVLNGVAHWEVELLDEERESRLQSFNFEIDKSVDLRKLNTNAYSWSKNQCYLAPKILNGSSTIFIFDVEQRKLLTTHIDCTNIYDISIDEDGIFAHLTENAAYRFEMKQPDRLDNLSWFHIRRLSMFRGNDMYKKLLDQLPLKFRPFSFN